MRRLMVLLCCQLIVVTGFGGVTNNVKGIECVAHRGYWNEEIPENTVEAIKRAYDCGAEAFTCNYFEKAFVWAEKKGIKLNPKKPK